MFASAQKDSKTQAWETDRSIKSGHIYVVAYVNEIVPGREYLWDWMLDVYTLDKPIPCPAIGLGHVIPKPEHDHAMHALNMQLADMRMHWQAATMPSPRVTTWQFPRPPAVFADATTNKEIDITSVELHTAVQHKDWDGPMCTMDLIWYQPIKRGIAPLKTFQARVLGHLRVLKKPVSFVFPSRTR